MYEERTQILKDLLAEKEEVAKKVSALEDAIKAVSKCFELMEDDSYISDIYDSLASVLSYNRIELKDLISTILDMYEN